MEPPAKQPRLERTLCSREGVTVTFDKTVPMAAIRDLALRELKGGKAAPVRLVTSDMGVATGGDVLAGSRFARFQGREDLKPIIVVPASMRATVHKMNIKPLVTEGKYVESEPRAWAGRLAIKVEVEGEICGTKMSFRVVDSTRGFSRRDWESVVAVFVDGTTWQFKDWPFKSMVDLFHSMKGFFIHFDDQPLAASPLIQDTVGKWGCTILTLRRNARHQDAGVAGVFWRTLENFMRRKTSIRLERPPNPTPTREPRAQRPGGSRLQTSQKSQSQLKSQESSGWKESGKSPSVW